MSQSRSHVEAESSALEENRKKLAARGDLRFTPLRSYIARAQALSREAGEPALSRLVPAPRLQS